MQYQNVKEYQIIREEMSKLKDCITTYMGFTLGGTGLVFAGFAATSIEGYPPIFASLLLSLVVSLVLTIIYYKFNSHNRYAGYCKILNQERFDSKSGNVNASSIRDFMAWEICMDQLRYSDIKKAHLLKMCRGIYHMNIKGKTLRKTIRRFSGKTPTIDKCKFFKGLWLIIKSFFRSGKSRSWQFPLYITLIFGIIVITFIILAAHFCVLMYRGDPKNIFWNSYLFFIFISLPVLFQVILWIKYIGKLHMLMQGSATVDAYCWKFLPIRYKFIQEIDENIIYNITSMREHEAE